MMGHKFAQEIQAHLLSFWVQDRWRTFAGIDIESLASLLESACDSYDIAYDHRREEPSTSDRFGFGAHKKNHVYSLSDNDQDVTIKLISAYADPVSRAVFRLFTTEELMNQMKNLAIVDIYPINDDSEELLRPLFSHIIDDSESSPWDFSHHPRFTTSFLLDYKTRLLWEFWRID